MRSPFPRPTRSHPLRSAALLVLGVLVLTSAALVSTAHAVPSVPYPGLCTVPAVMPLVGHTYANGADVLGEYTVLVRDVLGNPISGSRVTVDYSGCPDIRVAQTQPEPLAVVTCQYHYFHVTTYPSGIARFRIVGGASGGGGSPGCGFGTLKVYADGIYLGTSSVAAYDLDGLDGVNANDLSAWLADFGSGLSLSRADYDGNQVIGPNDLAMWLSVYFHGGSQDGASSLGGGVCP